MALTADAASVVDIPYSVLDASSSSSGASATELDDALSKAFGPGGLGILTVSGVPDFEKLRGALLPLAREFAELPDDAKQKYEDEKSFYAFGWSHGKEKLSDGKFDTHKGSYYNNPVEDRPCDDDELMERHPSYLRPNVWPAVELPALEPSFKNLGTCIVNVGQKLLRHCDAYVRSRKGDDRASSLERAVSDSRCHKARLLYYFPVSAVDGSTKQDTWCGWHKDHGTLTGLVSARFTDAAGSEVPNPAKDAGLFIRNRAGEVTKVNIPKTSLAFQIGESAQVASGGLLRATPHCVCPGATPTVGVDRSTFAVFMQPSFDYVMSVREEDASSVQTDVDRWSPGVTFGEFTERTLNKYY
mmetsp:Transcript_7835/g.17804  ORF Transcript_7835/g.17804 Transcript_7835/m.17804 type:complete len:357 (-) Transcript_7835:77-1147(-)